MNKSKTRKFIVSICLPLEQEVTIQAKDFDEANDIGWQLADKFHDVLSKLNVMAEVGSPEIDIVAEDDEDEDD